MKKINYCPKCGVSTDQACSECGFNFNRITYKVVIKEESKKIKKKKRIEYCIYCNNIKSSDCCATQRAKSEGEFLLYGLGFCVVFAIILAIIKILYGVP